MPRRFITILAPMFSIVSLLLCMAMVGLWVASYWIGYRVSRSRGSNPGAYGRVEQVRWELQSENGGLRLIRERAIGMILDDTFTAGRFAPSTGGRYPYWLAAESEKFKVLGFQCVTSDWSDRNVQKHAFNLVLPWALPSAMSLSIFLVLVRSATKRRTIAGNCSACGYDLRASPERCPECGTAVR